MALPTLICLSPLLILLVQLLKLHLLPLKLLSHFLGLSSQHLPSLLLGSVLLISLRAVAQSRRAILTHHRNRREALSWTSAALLWGPQAWIQGFFASWHLGWIEDGFDAAQSLPIALLLLLLLVLLHVLLLERLLHCRLLVHG